MKKIIIILSALAALSFISTHLFNGAEFNDPKSTEAKEYDITTKDSSTQASLEFKDKKSFTKNRVNVNAGKESATESKKDKIEVLQIDTDLILADRDAENREGASRSFKEVLTLEVDGEKSYELKLDRSLNRESVGSVVVVSLDGPILLHNFSVNSEDKSAKSYEEGQETMTGDWVVVDDFTGDLEKVNLHLSSSQRNRLRVYIQYYN